MTGITTGTKEWADSNVNFVTGCSHDCRYCYAKKMAIRFKKKTAGNWHEMQVRQKDVDKNYRKRRGRVMFPTSHDLTPNILPETLIILKKLLDAGNEVLITTKPHCEVISRICVVFDYHPNRDNIQFRFTITSIDDEKLKYWEPGATVFRNRMMALYRAYFYKYKTSISIEPCLDEDPRALIEELRPCVTESIWLGPMNYCGEREFNSKETLRNWLEWFKDDPLVRFKDSVYKKLGVEKI